MDLQRKLEILADAAKYDASCASSGAARKDSRGSQGVGSTGGAGICHSYAPDGRCISLLKVLLTNARNEVRCGSEACRKRSRSRKTLGSLPASAPGAVFVSPS